MKKNAMYSEMEKLPIGIEGLDAISKGGVPKGRPTLICGTSGSAKTVLGVQFLAEGIKQYDNSAVFVTFEETPEDIMRNMQSFGWDIRKWIAEGKWAFVDASPPSDGAVAVSGEFDLSALIARIELAVKKVSAQRVTIDSLGSIFTQFNDNSVIRQEIFRMTVILKRLQVTSLITTERIEEYGPVSRYHVEEFVMDNVIILRNVLGSEKRRRTVEILKFRGTDHQNGEFPFTIAANKGIVALPICSIQLSQTSSSVRIRTGNEELDAMCGGGYFHDSIILISGATGTGKTLLSSEFIAGGTSKGQKCLLFGFEESRDQLYRNAAGWGVDYESLEKQGLLRTICRYPESDSLENHSLWMMDQIDEFQPKIIAVDSLSALERISTLKTFREFFIGITSFIKMKKMAGLFTSITHSLMGGTSVTASHISTVTDSIIMLRYIEVFGEIRRAIVVLKMRGSTHDKEIRQYTIDGNGMHIGKSLRNATGIYSGKPVQAPSSEIEVMDKTV